MMPSSALSFAMLLALLPSPLLASAPMTPLTDPLARCLDSTLSAYYIEPSSDPVNATKFVIYLEGGGECASNVSCTKATTSVLGSSKVRSEAGNAAAHRRSSMHAPLHYFF